MTEEEDLSKDLESFRNGLLLALAALLLDKWCQQFGFGGSS